LRQTCALTVASLYTLRRFSFVSTAKLSRKRQAAILPDILFDLIVAVRECTVSDHVNGNVTESVDRFLYIDSLQTSVGERGVPVVVRGFLSLGGIDHLGTTPLFSLSLPSPSSLPFRSRGLRRKPP